VALFKKLRPIGPIARRTNADDSVDIVDSEGVIVFDGAGSAVSLDAFNALSADVTTLSGTVSALGVTVGNHTTSIANNTTAISNLTTTVSGHTTSISNLTTIVSGHTTNITTLNSTVVTLQTEIDAMGTVGSDAITGTTPDGVVDNGAAINAAVNPTGTFVTAGKVHASFGLGGTYLTGQFVDLHPSVSIESYSRGGTLLVPANNLSATNADGAESALIRIVRDTPSSASNLAWSPTLSGFNIDFRGTTQTHQVHGIRTPNPNPANNPNDPDTGYVGNKDYVAGRVANMDVVSASGSGWVVGSGNGRADVHSARMLNCALNGFDFGGNDVVMSGHWAVGGNGLFGLKVGLAAGFFATTGNLWGSSASRSLTCGAAWFNQRKMFALGYSEFNDWLRMDGGAAYRGGVISNNVFAQFGSNFVSDGVAIDLTPNDSRLQANTGTIEYQSLEFSSNIHCRTDKCGNFGTVSAINTTTDVLTSNAHGLANNTLVGIATTGTMPAPLIAGSMYYVVNKTTNDFQVSLTSGGAAIDLTTAGTGTLTYYTFQTPSNVGGAITGQFGTAPAYLHDIGGSGSQPAMVNIREGYCSTGNVKPWAGVSQVCTISVAAPGVVTTSTVHNLQVGYRVVFGTTLDLPTGLLAGVVYYVSSVPTTTTFQVASVLGGASITTSGTPRVGVNTYWNVTDLAPYNVHNGAQANYLYQDAATSLLRAGALGATHSHIALGIAEIDPPNYDYAVEIGDRTQPSSVNFRNALYGFWEFAKGIQYTDTAYDTRAITNGQTRTIQLGQMLQRLTVAGGGIAGATIQLPTDMNASQFLDIFITGGAIATLTWSVSGAGSINTGTPAPPTYTQGNTQVRLWYQRSTNSWYVIGQSAGDRSGTLGRVDATGAQAGIVGEVQQSSIVQGSAVSITASTTVVNVTSLALTAGNWRISWAVKHRGSGATVTNVSAGVNTTSATLAPTKAEQCSEEVVAYTTQTGNLKTLSGSNYLVNVNTSTTVYLSATATFSAGTMTAFGVLTAERVS
jgi:hypothetical protein